MSNPAHALREPNEATRRADAPVRPEATEEPVGTVRRALQATPVGTAVIVDFDETLWLRNSTEEFLRGLKPHALAWLVLVLLELVRPWRLVGGRARQHLYRDWLRTVVCIVLLPWSLAAWRRRAPELAARWRNEPLLAVLRERSDIPLRVATFGLGIIVAPLLRHIAPDATLFAAGSVWSGHRIRLVGKAAWIERQHGSEIIARAAVITDSEADADLLKTCCTPVLVRWPQAEYRPALSDSYVPFRYTQRAKRPGANYMLYGVLLEDIVLLWLSFAWIMPDPVIGAVALLFLHLSFWTVYEIGYAENDTRAAAREDAPVAAAGCAAEAACVKPPLAWLVAVGLALPAVGLLVLLGPGAFRWPVAGVPAGPLLAAGLATWLIYLATARGAYLLYNRLDVASRGLFYLVLQMLRTLGYALLLPLNAVGACALLSLVLARWVKYLVYRDTGRRLPEDQRLLSVIFFSVLAVAGLAVDPQAFAGVQSLAVLCWLCLYAHRRLRKVLRRVRLVRI